MTLERALVPWDAAAFERLLGLIDGRRIVLLGEASHGTHEFYDVRARITRALIEAGACDAVVAEADWPDAYRVNCFVRGVGDDADAEQALRGFRRFPSWMWRNTVVRDFVAWLRSHNANTTAPTGFYGMDLYSLGASIQAVLDYLDRVDPEAAARARERYACFEHVGEEPQRYGHATEVGGADPCEDAVVEQLVELQRRAGEYAARDGGVPSDAHFFAEQNARLVRNAERYYRAMFRGRDESWNLRDRHMAETLAALAARIERDHGRPARLVAWAHNSHLGDARATEMGRGGELNVGQLVRERWDGETFLLGFTTAHGTVTAASDWGGAAERKRVRAPLDGSIERLFADQSRPAFLLEDPRVVAGDRLERAIGVIYRPQTERWSHYFHADLARQFDAVVHIDETSALQPLDPTEHWQAGEPPETFPSSI